VGALQHGSEGRWHSRLITCWWKVDYRRICAELRSWRRMRWWRAIYTELSYTTTRGRVSGEAHRKKAPRVKKEQLELFYAKVEEKLSVEEATSVQGVMQCVAEELTAEMARGVQRTVKDWWDEEVEAAMLEKIRLKILKLLEKGERMFLWGSVIFTTNRDFPFPRASNSSAETFK
ncbi:hypothetical protein CAPTEDRAFT_211437, partial [Capitella teleta]